MVNSNHFFRAAFIASIAAGLFAWVVSIPTASAQNLSEVQSGTLYLKSSPDTEVVEALRVATTMQAQITGNVARVHVMQQFSNTGGDWVEGLYVFPLAANAAVDELLMHVGERTVRGDIQEKAQAQANYAQARSEGKRASIVDQERPNMFTTAVANIAPHSAVSIEITYLETISYRDARYTLRLPLAITPRYTPGAGLDPAAPLAAANAAIVNALSGTTATPERVTAPRQNVDITIELAAGVPLKSVESLHHLVTMNDDGSGKHMGVDRLKDGDRFNIIRFASDYSYLYVSPRPVSAATRSEANRFIAALRASGGTEMRAPLERAMSMPASEGFLEQIVFITDGSVAGSIDARPWPWADTRPSARLTIRAGSETHELMILEGSSGRNLAFGPAHDPASVMPGEAGNSVIEGHRDTHFAVLRGIRLGDTLSVDTVRRRHAMFVVTSIEVIDSRRVRIALDAGEPRLTLVTCYPFDAVVPGGPLRLVVTADRQPAATEI